MSNNENNNNNSKNNSNNALLLQGQKDAQETGTVVHFATRVGSSNLEPVVPGVVQNVNTPFPPGSLPVSPASPSSPPSLSSSEEVQPESLARSPQADGATQPLAETSSLSSSSSASSLSSSSLASTSPSSPSSLSSSEDDQLGSSALSPQVDGATQPLAVTSSLSSSSSASSSEDRVTSYLPSSQEGDEETETLVELSVSSWPLSSPPSSPPENVQLASQEEYDQMTGPHVDYLPQRVERLGQELLEIKIDDTHMEDDDHVDEVEVAVIGRAETNESDESHKDDDEGMTDEEEEDLDDKTDPFADPSSPPEDVQLASQEEYGQMTGLHVDDLPQRVERLGQELLEIKIDDTHNDNGRILVLRPEFHPPDEDYATNERNDYEAGPFAAFEIFDHDEIVRDLVGPKRNRDYSEEGGALPPAKRHRLE